MGAVDGARELERFGGRACLLLVEGGEAFVAAPAVVAASDDDIDLLERVLADVAQPEGAGRAVEAVPPGVAEAVSKDLWSATAAGEGVVRRDGVVCLAGDVQAQDLAAQDIGILARPFGVARAAAVAGG